MDPTLCLVALQVNPRMDKGPDRVSSGKPHLVWPEKSDSFVPIKNHESVRVHLFVGVSHKTTGLDFRSVHNQQRYQERIKHAKNGSKKPLFAPLFSFVFLRCLHLLLPLPVLPALVKYNNNNIRMIFRYEMGLKPLELLIPNETETTAS